MESTIDFGYGQIGIGQQGELLTYPQYVIFSYMDMINRLLRIKTGIELNVNAKLFFPMDTKLLCSHCSKKVTIEELNKKQIEQTIQDLKDKIDSNNNDETEDIKSQLTVAEDNQTIEDDWIRAKSNIKTQAVRVAVQQAYIKNLKNWYEALKTVDNEKNEEYREEEINATVQENPKKNQLTNESDNMFEGKEKEKYDKERKTKKRKTKNKLLKTTLSTHEKSNENGRHDWNEESYHIEKVSMEALKNKIDQQLLNDKKHIIDDDTDSEDDDRSYVSIDSLGLTSKEREEYKVLHRKMNQEEESEEGSDVSNDIPLVPLELLDEVEDKLLISEENCERLRNEKVAVERQYKDKIDSLEKALRNKTELLIKALKDKGDTDVRVKKPDNELFLT